VRNAEREKTKGCRNALVLQIARKKKINVGVRQLRLVQREIQGDMRKRTLRLFPGVRAEAVASVMIIKGVAKGASEFLMPDGRGMGKNAWRVRKIDDLLHTAGFPFKREPHSKKKRNGIVDHTVERSRKNRIENDRARDNKDLCADPKDQPLALVINGGGNHRVGKAGNGDERACAGNSGDAVKNADPGKDGGKENERYRNERARRFFVKTEPRKKSEKELTKTAEKPPDKKCEDAIFQNRGS
jgi:hypothetical protein